MHRAELVCVCPSTAERIATMMCRVKAMRPGQIVPVGHVHGGPELPKDLPASSLVTLLRFHHGYWEVEYAGRILKVFMGNLNPGMEYLVNGSRWLDEKHPLVLAVLRGERGHQRQAGNRKDRFRGDGNL